MIPPFDGEFAEGEEGGGFAEGFLEPFILVVAGLEVCADMREFVSELVDVLGEVATTGF